MRRGCIWLGIILSVVVLPNGLASAKKINHHSKQIIDPTCPVDKYGRPNAECNKTPPELTKVKCPNSWSDMDCSLYSQGYGAALEDKKVMGETEFGTWKDDTGVSPSYKAGYEAGWRK